MLKRDLEVELNKERQKYADLRRGYEMEITALKEVSNGLGTTVGGHWSASYLAQNALAKISLILKDRL